MEVIDSGIGIPDSFLPYVFEPFRQADSSWTRKHDGLGLGLAIAKAIIDLHGGSITATSGGTGAGATFRVALPSAGGELERPAADSESSSAHAHEKPLAGVRVLVVDDDDARTLTTAMLLDQGCDVCEATSASEAFALFRTFLPHVLATDLAMPGEDGVSLLERVRVEYGHVPAIAISAFSGPTELLRVSSAGFDGHVTKPFALSDLTAQIAALVSAPPSSARAAGPPGQPARWSVLIVEDDLPMAHELAELLRHEGYAVHLARNGSEAWMQLAAGLRPSVIVLDLLMPVMDGWTLRRKLLGEPELAPIPVVVLTGVSTADVAEIERVTDVFRKPFDAESLLTIVARHAKTATSVDEAE